MRPAGHRELVPADPRAPVEVGEGDDEVGDGGAVVAEGSFTGLMRSAFAFEDRSVTSSPVDRAWFFGSRV